MQRWEEAVEAYKEAFRLRPDRAMGYRILNDLNFCTERLKLERQL
jgi:hypothetical protein